MMPNIHNAPVLSLKHEGRLIASGSRERAHQTQLGKRCVDLFHACAGAASSVMALHVGAMYINHLTAV